MSGQMAENEFVTACIYGAREHERQARELRKLAAKVEHPPEGVEVYVTGVTGIAAKVTFIGPPLVLASAAAGGAGDREGGGT